MYFQIIQQNELLRVMSKLEEDSLEIWVARVCNTTSLICLQVMQQSELLAVVSKLEENTLEIRNKKESR